MPIINKGIRRFYLRVKTYSYSQRTKYNIKILRVLPVTHFTYSFVYFSILTVSMLSSYTISYHMIKNSLQVKPEHQWKNQVNLNEMCSLVNSIIVIVVIWSLSCGQLFCHPTDCTLPGSSVHGISQQEHWSGLPFPPPGDLPNPGIEPASFMSPALAGRFFTTSTTWEAHSQRRDLILKNKIQRD